jgi:SP family sugar:H+ symporter-like MFS transporter
MVKLSKPANIFRLGRGKATASDGAVTAETHKHTGYDDSPIPRLSIHSFIMGVFVSMGGFIFGYDTGQVSGYLGMANFLSRFGQKDSNGDGGYHFSNVRSGLIVALLSVGTLMGALIAGPVADRIGRKWSISAWCVMLHIGLIVQISATQGKWYQGKYAPGCCITTPGTDSPFSVVVGRWIAGLGVGALSLLVPMYQGESAPRQIRGALIRCLSLPSVDIRVF